MELTRKQTEFWATLLGAMILVAVLITLIDYQIKASILEQATKLRLAIEKEELNHGRNAKSTDANGVANVSGNDAAISPDLLVDNATGMEAGNDANRATAKAGNQIEHGPAKRVRASRATTIPATNKRIRTRGEA